VVVTPRSSARKAMAKRDISVSVPREAD